MSHEHENLIISLMEARKKGKTIQYKSKLEKTWIDLGDSDYDFPRVLQYRIKPDEPREFLLAKHKGGKTWWVVEDSIKYPTDNYDYIRVREILED